MLRTVWKKPSIRCTPNGNQARARSPSAAAGTRSMTPGLAPRPVARYPAWSDQARNPPAQTPGRSITPATDSSHLVRRSSSTRPSTRTHQKSAASPSWKSTSPLSKWTSSPAAIRSWSCSSLSPVEQEDATEIVNEHQPHLPTAASCPRPAPPAIPTRRRHSGADHAPSPRRTATIADHHHRRLRHPRAPSCPCPVEATRVPAGQRAVNEPARRAADGPFSQPGSARTRHGPRLTAKARQRLPSIRSDI